MEYGDFACHKCRTDTCFDCEDFDDCLAEYNAYLESFQEN